jgi:hypothetical protein
VGIAYLEAGHREKAIRSFGLSLKPIPNRSWITARENWTHFFRTMRRGMIPVKIMRLTGKGLTSPAIDSLLI